MTCSTVATGLPSISRMRGLVSDIGGFEAMNYPADTIFCRESQGASGAEEMPVEELLQEQEFFGDPTYWWDNIRNKRKIPKVRLWMDNRHKPEWVDSQLPTWDAGAKAPPESMVPSLEGQGSIERLGANEGPLRIGICRKLCELGRIFDALDALNLLVQQGCHVEKYLLYRVLKRCIAHKDLVLVRRIHALTTESGYEGDAFLATHLISLYAPHGRLEEAMQVFSKVCRPSTYIWATIIVSYSRHGEAAQAIRLYRQMLQSATVKPDNRVYLAVLKACANAGDLFAGKEVHAHFLASPGKPDPCVQTALISMYAKCGSLGDARRVFEGHPERSIVAWTAMVAGYAQHGMSKEALSLYSRMQHEGITTPDSVTFVCLLKACASAGVEAFDQGKQLHAQIQERGLQDDVVLGASLVNMYGKCGSLEDARRVFDGLPKRNVVAWTAMFAAYSQQGMGQEALSLYSSMQQEGITTPNAVTFLCLLQACANVGVGALEHGRQLHAQIEEQGLQGLGGSLVNMYAKCGSLEDARRVFDRLTGRNVVTWNAMFTGYAQHGMGQEALSLYRGMQQRGLTTPDSVTFLCLLQACASVGVGALEQGKQLHAQIEERGLQADVVLGGSLVNMYAKCGSLEDARRVFDILPDRTVVTWTTLIAGYAQQGMGQEALSLYSSMQRRCLSAPDSVTFVCLLQACASVGIVALGQGKQLHAHIEERGLQYDVVLGGSLVHMYAKCGSLENARQVFDGLQERNVVSWNAMLAGYGEQGMGQEALSLYSSMQQEGIITPDSVTCVSLLRACASVGEGALEQGKQLHAQIKERGLLVSGGSLVNMYAKCGSLWDAQQVFDSLPERDVGAWTAMIAGYADQGMGKEALSLYSGLQLESFTTPDSVTYVCLLQACASVGVGALDQGKQLHAEIQNGKLQDDVVLGGSLIHMYTKCGSLEDARCVFDRLPERNVVSWNKMLAGYAQQGMAQEALSLYSSMQQEGMTKPDSVTFVYLLQACASVGSIGLDQGKQLHAQIEEGGLQGHLAVGGSLVNMYAKCGSLENACKVFDRLPERDVVAWTAMLAGYTQQGMGQEALSLYSSMQREGITPPNPVTFVCLLQACASLAALPLGKQLHAQIEERGLQTDLVVGAALVNMYAKCGSMFDSQQVFDSLPERTREAWGALIGGYARLGDTEVVFDLVERMQLEGMPPDGITFLCLLTVCSHVGRVDKGRQYFKAMTLDYGISPTIEHNACMVDILGRAGHLDEALQMAKTMPFQPSITVWHTLLGACRKWKNIEIGLQAFKFAVSVDAKDAASYVLMSNIYAGAQMWDRAQEVQARRKKSGAWKKPGQSWLTDMAGVVHTFVVGDKKHPESEGIYARLEQLVPKLKKAGYVPHLQSSLRDVSDDEKEAELCGHSEKLAIAYALHKTPDGTTIRIVKNLRVCADCHSATAYISEVENRTVICRDASRFHVFKEGECSCGDYW